MGALTEREAWIALAHCVEPGDESMGQLVGRLGPVAAVDEIAVGSARVRHAEGLAARLAAFDQDVAEARAASCGSRIVTRLDREWPSQLDALGGRAPMALWVCGAADLRLLALRSVAVVGARACTPYGEEIARNWAADLAAERWCVISGAAFGIDAAAHRGALAGRGTTIAVVAGGVDVAYPTAHASLLARIADEGLVVSETPPGESVRRQRFLTRNRLIAGLGRATLVVEAAVRSGTTATARAAWALNRPVLAVPGPVTSAASAGCHRMIRDGEAMLVADVADLLGLLDLDRVGLPATVVAPAERSTVLDRLTGRERSLLDSLPARGSVTFDDVIRASGLAGPDVLAGLGLLAARGLVTDASGGWRLVTPR